MRVVVKGLIQLATVQGRIYEAEGLKGVALLRKGTPYNLYANYECNKRTEDARGKQKEICVFVNVLAPIYLIIKQQIQTHFLTFPPHIKPMK